jgi:hypothetical protein
LFYHHDMQVGDMWNSSVQGKCFLHLASMEQKLWMVYFTNSPYSGFNWSIMKLCMIDQTLGACVFSCCFNLCSSASSYSAVTKVSHIKVLYCCSCISYFLLQEGCSLFEFSVDGVVMQNVSPSSLYNEYTNRRTNLLRTRYAVISDWVFNRNCVGTGPLEGICFIFSLSQMLFMHLK